MKFKASLKKINANRANAKHSTGPKSAKGKSNSSSNATKHGAYSVRALLPGEDRNLHQAIKDEQQKIYSPKTYVEKALVDQLVSELWLLRRIARAEQLYMLEVREETKKDASDDLPSADKSFIMEGTVPGETSLPTAKALVAGASPAQAQKEMLDGVVKRLSALQLEHAYGRLFVYDDNERMQKLTSMKRSVIQTILGIERDLDRRLLQRKALESKIADV